MAERFMGRRLPGGNVPSNLRTGKLYRPETFIGNWPLEDRYMRVFASQYESNPRGGFLDLSDQRYYLVDTYGADSPIVIAGYHYYPEPDRNNPFDNRDPNHEIFYFIDSKGYLQSWSGGGHDVTKTPGIINSPEYQRGLKYAKGGDWREKAMEDKIDRGHPSFFSSQQAMSLASKMDSPNGDENVDADDQTDSAAKVSLKATTPNLTHVKTGFVIRKDNLLSKSFSLQHAFSFIEKYIFNHSILKTDVYKTVPVILETISEKAGISVQAHEELANVDVHMMTHKSVFLQVYVVGHEKVDQASDNKGFFAKVKGAFSSSSSGTQIKESKDYGLKKSELISASLLEGVPLIGPKSVTPTSAYSRILQFYEGKSLVFQSKFPSQDLVQSNNEQFLVFYLNQRIYETADGGHTAVRSVRDPTTGRQINLEDIDGYWLLCFGKSRLLYIIKVNIAPREEYTGRETSSPNPPPSDLPPARSPQTPSSSLKKFVPQTSSSGSSKSASFFVNSSEFLLENTDSKGRSYEDESSVFQKFNKRVVDLYRVSNAIVEKQENHFSVIAKGFFRNTITKIGTFYLTSDYAIKSGTSAMQIPNLSTSQLIGFLFPEEDATQVFEAVKSGTSDLEDKNNIIKEYFTNTSDGNSEQLSAALVETHVIQMDYGLLLKMIDFMSEVSPTFHTLSILGILNSLERFSDSSKQHSHEVLSKITGSTFYKKYFLESLGKNTKKSPQRGIDESDLMTYFSCEEQFMRFTNYTTFLVLYDMFVEITKKMGDGVKNCLLAMSNLSLSSGIVEFVKQAILKTMFCFPEFYLRSEQEIAPSIGEQDSKNKKGLEVLKEHIINQRNITLEDLTDVSNFELLNRPQAATNEAVAVGTCLDILSFVSFSAKKVLVALDKSKQVSFKVFKEEIVEISLEAEVDELNPNTNKLSSTGSRPTASQEQILQDNVLTSTSDTISTKWSFVLSEATEDRTFTKSEMERAMEYEQHRITGRSLLSEPKRTEQYSNPPMIYDELLEIILGTSPDKIPKKDKQILQEQLVRMRQYASLRLLIITCLRSLVLTGRFVGHEKYTCHNVVKCFNESIPYLNDLMINTCTVNAIAEDLMLGHYATHENFDLVQEQFTSKTQEYVLNITGDVAANLFM